MSTLDTPTTSARAASVDAAQPLSARAGLTPPGRSRQAVGFRPGLTTLSLSGELDLACSARLDRALRRLDRSPGTVDVDLAAVTFADSHGVQPLLDAAERRRVGGIPALRLVDVSPAVTWLLDLLGSPLGDQPNSAVARESDRPRGST